MKSTGMIVAWSFDVECPYCEADIDLSDQDDDGIFSGAIFNNNWDDLIGVECHCPDCSKDFTISKVET